MERRRKLHWVEPPTDNELRGAIAEFAASDRDRAAMGKDAFLLEAALVTSDRIVASLDETARALFGALAGQMPRIGKIVWINPGSEDDSALAWLRSGAKLEPTRRLGHRLKRKG